MNFIKTFRFVIISFLIVFLFSCAGSFSACSVNKKEQVQPEPVKVEEIQISYKEKFNFFSEDPYLFIFVDKETALSEDYEPQDLIKLKSGHLLRAAAAASLEEMSAAAAAEGLNLVVSSAYRSYKYQVEVYGRHVKNMGQAEADRVSARPGHSQHQLGLVVDFGSITNDFARTKEGIWLFNNASHFGWSISYPRGYEDLTGYSWESWHYRFVGKELAEFIDSYFDGIQHNALKFLYEIEKNNAIVTDKDFMNALKGGIIFK